MPSIGTTNCSRRPSLRTLSPCSTSVHFLSLSQPSFGRWLGWTLLKSRKPALLITCLWVYIARVLHKMKKTKSNLCTACSNNAIGSLEHYLLYCPFTQEIREHFIPQFIQCNPKITSLIDNEAALVISILDPESNLLPEDIRQNWESSNRMYALSRDYVYNIYRKLEKHYEKQYFA